MTFRRHFISLTLASTAAFTLYAPLSASAQTVLKAADVHPPGYPNVMAIENLGK